MLIKYRWTGITPISEKVTGVLYADHRDKIKFILKQKNITLISLREIGFSITRFSKEITLLYRQLSTLLKADISLVSSFDMLMSYKKNVKFNSLLVFIKLKLESGNTFTEALTCYSHYFEKLDRQFIQIGETTGKLEFILEKIHDYRSHKEKIKKDIRQALAYPGLLLLLSIGLSSLMLLSIIPEFEHLFNESHLALPALTQGMIHCSRFFSQHVFLIATIVPLLVIGMVVLRRHWKYFQSMTDTFSLEIPMIGALLTDTLFARFSWVLGLSLEAGIPLADALDCTAPIFSNHAIYQATQQLQTSVTSGNTLSDSMKNIPFFPTLMKQLLHIGESSGTIEATLKQLSLHYEAEIKQKIALLKQLAEPLIMLVVGGLIGIMVIAMYLPLFKLGKVI